MILRKVPSHLLRRDCTGKERPCTAHQAGMPTRPLVSSSAYGCWGVGADSWMVPPTYGLPRPMARRPASTFHILDCLLSSGEMAQCQPSDARPQHHCLLRVGLRRPHRCRITIARAPWLPPCCSHPERLLEGSRHHGLLENLLIQSTPDAIGRRRRRRQGEEKERRTGPHGACQDEFL